MGHGKCSLVVPSCKDFSRHPGPCRNSARSPGVCGVSVFGRAWALGPPASHPACQDGPEVRVTVLPLSSALRSSSCRPPCSQGSCPCYLLPASTWCRATATLSCTAAAAVGQLANCGPHLAGGEAPCSGWARSPREVPFTHPTPEPDRAGRRARTLYPKSSAACANQGCWWLLSCPHGAPGVLADCWDPDEPLGATPPWWRWGEPCAEGG